MCNLLLALSLSDRNLWLLIAIAVVAYLIIDKTLAVKHHLDTVQFRAGQAGGVAAEIGFQLFDKLLHWAAAGNVKEIRAIVKEIWEKYCQDARGPMRLAHDVFIATWRKLRVDDEYGNQCRQLVVQEALGLDINDKTDVTIARAAERAERIGWGKIGKAGEAWAARDWRNFTPSIKALFDEFMEPDGEKKIALRVARPTLEVLWNDTRFHNDIQALIVEYYGKVQAEQAAYKQQVLEEAQQIQNQPSNS